MKKILFTILMASSLVAIHSCGRDFEEINTDTSKILNPSVGSLLAPVQLEMSTYNYKRANDYTFDVMQSALDFPNEGNTYSRYYLTEASGTGFWNTSYKWLKQVRDMRIAAEKENDKNYLAIAKVMNAWIYSNLTDAFGDIPFSEALKMEEGIMKPKFDKQKDIYTALLNDLKEANSLFDTTKKLSEIDLFYNANNSNDGILQWKKFCNSLSLRLLTRSLNKNGDLNVHVRIQEIVNNPTVYPLFTSNTDSAVLSLSGIAPYLPPVARPQDFTTGRAAGEFFIDEMKKNNDPRMSMFFSTAKDLATNTSIGYKGAPSGYQLGTVFSYQPSNLNQNLAKAPMKILLMTYSELQFILAELSFKNIIGGNTETYYKNGVTSIIEQWGAVVPANYFTNTNVAYNQSLERIMLQKYLSLFFVDHQQWYEFNRTGLPMLPNNGGLMNDGKMPKRFMYPPNAKVMNPENYQNAAQAIGGDNINTKLWWQQ
ncbi:SusD/RagB family nutrient-binding outer membrane lipoprotein [Amniculibacterium sp. G2-70]|uniref:SusD/RagB family nutrient-binding outer membrane lipoprotein n=1 Tax=Amniculibacterium sp. G2-70 TaxID=2767188 RepID=UPI0016548D45|nr:SusD/RagB family nutrient-binding outer membrane lipoprotein [Amniculibacterium sp. G2-70]